MYRFRLKNQKKKQICPNCCKKRFVNYFDFEKEEFLPNIVGKCDREINCGYHLKPKNYFNQKKININFQFNKKPIKYKPFNYLKSELLEQTNQHYKNNNFVKFLHTIFTKNEVLKIIEKYRIGTTKYFKNGTIFWQIDNYNRLRSGKVFLYKENGKRTKIFTWVHSILLEKGILKEFNLNICLFGLHLINSENKPIAIVESEKTACIMSVLFDKYTWLAVGSLNWLSFKRLEVIKNKKIVLYPDLGFNKKTKQTPYKYWNEKRIELNKLGFNISISNLLEKNATEDKINKGYDIADYFIAKQLEKKQELTKSDLVLLDKMVENQKFFNSITEENNANAKVSNK